MPTPTSQRGAAMLWALALVIGVSAMSALLFEREATMRRDATTDAEALAAVHAVEGGLAHVRHALARNADYAGETLTIGTCRVKAAVTRSENAGWRVALTSATGGKQLHVDLSPTKGLPKVVARR